MDGLGKRENYDLQDKKHLRIPMHTKIISFISSKTKCNFYAAKRMKKNKWNLMLKVILNFQ